MFFVELFVSNEYEKLFTLFKSQDSFILSGMVEIGAFSGNTSLPHFTRRSDSSFLLH